MDVKEYFAETNYQGFEKTLEEKLKNNNEIKEILQKILNNNGEIKNIINNN